MKTSIEGFVAYGPEARGLVEDSLLSARAEMEKILDLAVEKVFSATTEIKKGFFFKKIEIVNLISFEVARFSIEGRDEIRKCLSESGKIEKWRSYSFYPESFEIVNEDEFNSLLEKRKTRYRWLEYHANLLDSALILFKTCPPGEKVYLGFEMARSLQFLSSFFEKKKKEIEEKPESTDASS